MREFPGPSPRSTGEMWKKSARRHAVADAAGGLGHAKRAGSARPEGFVAVLIRQHRWPVDSCSPQVGVRQRKTRHCPRNTTAAWNDRWR